MTIRRAASMRWVAFVSAMALGGCKNASPTPTPDTVAVRPAAPAPTTIAETPSDAGPRPSDAEPSEERCRASREVRIVDAQAIVAARVEFGAQRGRLFQEHEQARAACKVVPAPGHLFRVPEPRFVPQREERVVCTSPLPPGFTEAQVYVDQHFMDLPTITAESRYATENGRCASFDRAVGFNPQIAVRDQSATGQETLGEIMALLHLDPKAAKAGWIR